MIKKSKKRKTTDEGGPKKKKKNESKRANGFDRGMVAEEILGATETSGEVHFLIKWKNVNDAELVPSRITNLKIPQMVIAFYEARLTWSTNSNKSSDETDDPEATTNGEKNSNAEVTENGNDEEVGDEAAPKEDSNHVADSTVAIN